MQGEEERKRTTAVVYMARLRFFARYISSREEYCGRLDDPGGGARAPPEGPASLEYGLRTYLYGHGCVG